MMKIQMGSAGGEQPDKQQLAEAMKDPEIQAILRDPQMNIILEQMQKDPKAASEIMKKDPQVAAAIQKLMAAGILRVG